MAGMLGDIFEVSERLFDIRDVGGEAHGVEVFK